MVRLGKVYQNYMVHVLPTNEKLVERAVGMIAAITGTDHDQALETLEKAGMAVPEAVIMQSSSCSKEVAEDALKQAEGNVRKAIELVKEGIV
jgi:N-acetylmuramic acid 6-phosphate etherase